jgi:hypothetical protein
MVTPSCPPGNAARQAAVAGHCARDTRIETVASAGGAAGLAPASGYLHPDYAASFREWGTPRLLRRAGAWALIRDLPGSERADAIGCYPLLACQHWPGLAADLEELGDRIVAFSAVLDPLAMVSEQDLRAAFPHVLRPFKEHFVIELSRKEPVGSGDHRRKARRALARVELDLIEEVGPLLDEWMGLYALLIRRHAISGLKAFSYASFAAQLRIPGMHAIRAAIRGKTVGITLWAEHGGNVYYHLGAQNQAGYACAASYAMVDAAVAWFRERGCRMLDLGAGAGLDRGSEGLTRFKRGWATGTLPARFGGRIQDRATYARLTAASGQTTTPYFPAYRKGEFG